MEVQSLHRAALMPFLSILILSVALHVAIISQIRWEIAPKRAKEHPIEVELTQAETVKPVERPPQKLERGKQPVEKPLAPKSLKSGPAADRDTNTQIDSAAKRGEEGNLPKTKLPVIKTIQKPTLNSGGPIEPLLHRSATSRKSAAKAPVIRVALPPTKRAKLALSPKKSNHFPSRETGGMEKGQIALGQTGIRLEPSSSLKRETQPYRIVAPSVAKPRKPQTERKAIGKSDVKGEAGYRRVLHKPPLPILDWEKDVTIMLKFTVLPNGAVDHVFPYQKADAQLERIAIELLQQYRFEPLLDSNAIQEGTIRFTIRRKE